MNVSNEMPIPQDMEKSGPAHPDAQKDFWLSVVRPAAAMGKLDKIKPVRAKTPRMRDVARKQNAAITRAVFSGTHSAAFRAGYDRIRWNHSTVMEAMYAPPATEQPDKAFIDRWFNDFGGPDGSRSA